MLKMRNDHAKDDLPRATDVPCVTHGDERPPPVGAREPSRDLARIREPPTRECSMAVNGSSDVPTTRERELRVILDTIPGLVAIMSNGGDVELVNEQVLDYF